MFLRIFLMIALMAAPQKVFAFDETAKAFADFIEALYISTQTANKEPSICIFGSDDISTYLSTKEKSKIIPEDASISKSANGCRVVYIAKSKEKLVKSFIGAFNQSKTVTIANFDSFVNNGGMIFVDLGRRDFELTVNFKTFKASGARLDSAIAALIINNK